jgi:Flp pilus assembly secretin CpaC
VEVAATFLPHTILLDIGLPKLNGYEVTTGQTGVPLLSRIPILGFFFKHTSESEDRQELLIFVTPRLVTTLASN